MRKLLFRCGLALAAALAGPARAEPPAADASAGAQVARAVFALDMQGREPQQVVTQLDTSAEKVFFFTELVGLEGRTITHRWEHDGQVVAEIPFAVSAQRWRVYSSKRLPPGSQGRWTVSVIDDSGKALHSETLGYALAGADPAVPTPPPAAPDPGIRP